MTRPLPATPRELDAALSELPEWRLDGERLHREFRFADFEAAFGFMARVARHAEALDHHPEWRNCYAVVEVWLETHDVGALTSLDFELARRMSLEALGPTER
jgi:4a-hydroxytetrahydrobiopterin dehydratase